LKRKKPGRAADLENDDDFESEGKKKNQKKKKGDSIKDNGSHLSLPTSLQLVALSPDLSLSIPLCRISLYTLWLGFLEADSHNQHPFTGNQAVEVEVEVGATSRPRRNRNKTVARRSWTS
jgi:hypothetical protein